MRRTVRASLVLLAAVGAHGTHPARADIFVTYIAVSCDPSSDRAVVRFGYGDNDDPPTFAPLPESLAGHWPTQLVQAKVSQSFWHDQPQEASCQLSNGVEVKARYADTESTRVGWRFSVWIDQKKVISRAPQTPPGCDACIVHSLLIDKSTIRRCDFHLPTDKFSEGNAYDVITTSVPIVCSEAAPLRGEPDWIEYPLGTDPHWVPAGSMRIESAADERLCRLLVIRSEPNGEKDGIYSRVPFGSEIVSLRNVGGAFEPFHRVRFDQGPNQSFGNDGVDVAELSLFDRSTSERVFRISSASHAFDGDLFVVTGLQVPQEQVVAFLAQELLSGRGFDTIGQKVAARGWLALTGDMTAYRSLRYTHFALFRFEGSSYLVAYSEAWDPAAILLKPLRSGTMQPLCVFQPVRPNL